MRILYFNYLYDIRGHSLGSAVKPVELFAAMGRLGHEIKICWMKKGPSGAQVQGAKLLTLLKKIVSRYFYDAKILLSNLVYLYRGLKIAEGFKPDLIVGRIERCVLSDFILARVKNIPFILEADCPAVYEALQFQKYHRQYKMISRLIEKINARLADATIVVSRELQGYFSAYGVACEEIHVVTNGADPDKFSPGVCAAAVIDKLDLAGSVVLGFIGSFSVWHGIDHLAALIKAVSMKDERVKFLLVGAGGKMKKWLEDFVATNSLQNKVIFAGYVAHEEMPQYVAAMDILLAPYPGLPFFFYSPVKIFEYLAAGKAVVTTAIGQIAEVITDGVNGVLCEPDNIPQMAERVDELIKMPQLRRKLSIAARNTVLSKYLWMQKAGEWEKICLGALRNSRRCRG